MPTISTLSVMVTLNAEGFSNGVSKVERDLERTRAAIAKTASKDLGEKMDFAGLRRNMMLENPAIEDWGGAGEMEARARMMEDLSRSSHATAAEMNMFTARSAEATASAGAHTERWHLSLRGVAKTAGLAAAGIETASLAAHMLSGNTQAAALAVKSLPWGIGHVAQSLELCLGLTTGMTRETERNKAVSESLARTFETMAQSAKAMRDFTRQSADEAARLQNRSELAGLSGDDRAKRETEMKTQDEISRAAGRRDAALAAVDTRMAKLQEEKTKMLALEAEDDRFYKGFKWLGLGDQGGLGKERDNIDQQMDQLTRQKSRIRAQYDTDKSAIYQTSADEAKATDQERTAKEVDGIIKAGEERRRAASETARVNQQLAEDAAKKAAASNESLTRQQAQLEIDRARSTHHERLAQELEIKESFRREYDAAQSEAEKLLVKERERLALKMAGTDRETLGHQTQIGADVGYSGHAIRANAREPMQVVGIQRLIELTVQMEEHLRRGQVGRFGK